MECGLLEDKGKGEVGGGLVRRIDSRPACRTAGRRPARVPKSTSRQDLTHMLRPSAHERGRTHTRSTRPDDAQRKQGGAPIVGPPTIGHRESSDARRWLAPNAVRSESDAGHPWRIARAREPSVGRTRRGHRSRCPVRLTDRLSLGLSARAASGDTVCDVGGDTRSRRLLR